MAKLPQKFLKAVQKMLSKTGFDATITRQTAPVTNPDDPLGPPITTVERTTVRVFLDEPQKVYRGGMLVGETNATLYVDLLSAKDADTSTPRNTLDRVTWFTQLNDVLERPSSTKLVLTAPSQKPEVNGQAVVCIHELEK